MSRLREKHAASGLPVQRNHDELHAGVAAVDLRTGQVAGMLRFMAGCTELFDVQVLPKHRRPMIENCESGLAGMHFDTRTFSYRLR